MNSGTQDKQQQDRSAGRAASTGGETAPTEKKGMRKIGLGAANMVENPDRPDEC